MFCRKCGNELPADAVYCHVCGYKLSTETSAQVSQMSVDTEVHQVTGTATEQKNAKKKKTGKKTKKIILAVVAAVLAVALIVVGCVVIPDAVNRKKREEEHRIMEEIKQQYASGFYEEARSLVDTLPKFKGDEDEKRNKIVLRVIDFGEKISTWEGTKYELLDEVELLMQDIYNLEYRSGYLFITNLSTPELDGAGYYLNTVIPSLRTDFAIMEELGEIMEEFSTGYYKCGYSIYNLFSNNGFSKSEAITIDTAFMAAYNDAVKALDEMKARYPDVTYIDDCINVVDSFYGTYRDYLKSYFYDISFRNGYVTFSKSYAENVQDKIDSFISIDTGTNMIGFSLANGFGGSYKGCGFAALEDDTVRDKYAHLMAPDYILVSITLLLNGNRAINFCEGGVDDHFGYLFRDIENIYYPVN